MSKTLYIMCGPAGVGKSTWAKNHANPECSVIVSRDKIRYSLVDENEYYFKKEKQVYSEFITQINDALHNNNIKEVYADATHLNGKSRRMLLNQLDLDKNIKIIAVSIFPSIEKAKEQNMQRQGRERVPNTIIANMYDMYISPKFDGIKYNKIAFY